MFNKNCINYWYCSPQERVQHSMAHQQQQTTCPGCKHSSGEAPTTQEVCSLPANTAWSPQNGLLLLLQVEYCQLLPAVMKRPQKQTLLVSYLYFYQQQIIGLKGSDMVSSHRKGSCTCLRFHKDRRLLRLGPE